MISCNRGFRIVRRACCDLVALGWCLVVLSLLLLLLAWGLWRLLCLRNLFQWVCCIVVAMQEVGLGGVFVLSVVECYLATRGVMVGCVRCFVKRCVL